MAHSKPLNVSFPVGTLVVNLLGSLAIGFLCGLFEKVSTAHQIRLFIFIGILGGFTTFSTFSIENFNLINSGYYKIAALNVLVTNIGGILLAFIGFFSSQMMLNLFISKP